MKQIEITTSCGRLRGREEEEHLEYRGIRYATAGRFEYPNLVTSWEGTYDATEYGPCSYQRRSFEDDAECNRFYHKEFRDNMEFEYSEDSLFLNIWSPKDAENCPVLMYIHGGSFTGGSGDEGHIDGTEFAKNGIIFVSFNYRLGPFGFCSHPDLTDDQGKCGNYGLYDQHMAIKWVKEHIQEFGGNPDLITLMGQSAGAMSVDIHASTPLEKNWFSGIMMSSGAGLQRLLLKPYTPEKTRVFWDAVMRNAHVSTIEELKKVEPKTLFYAWDQACKDSKFSIPYTLPVYDGKLLTKNTFGKKDIPDTPCMIGVTTLDMMPIGLKVLTCKWAKISNRHSGHRCYTYLFARDLPGDDRGAWHSSDLLYFFSSYKRNWRPFEEVDYEISKQMSGALCAFARKQNPDCDEIPAWGSGAKRPMVFCEHTGVAKWGNKKLFHNTFQKNVMTEK